MITNHENSDDNNNGNYLIICHDNNAELCASKLQILVHFPSFLPLIYIFLLKISGSRYSEGIKSRQLFPLYIVTDKVKKIYIGSTHFCTVEKCRIKRKTKMNV